MTVTLTGSEALVLSDALHRWETDGTIEAMEPPTKRVVNDLAAVLEPTVEVAFAADYDDHLRRAQADVLGA